ncbi:hypothetical protein ACFXI6_17750 [Streptomyces mirabilis]|uniref:hypothetical protein n=1 Tax=Streptomyces mirabilis TaxID=68239 RepID=UPI0036B46D1F
MAVTVEAVIPLLRDVRDAEEAVVSQLRADLAAEPARDHRQTLEDHIQEVDDHIHELNRRLEQLSDRGPLSKAFITLGGQAVSTGRVLWRQMSGLPSAVRTGHDGHTPQRLLKDIEEEFAVAAKAAAAARAAERFADEIGDSLDTDMLRGIRTDDERFLNNLDHSLEEAADVVVRVKTSEAGGGTAPAS